jgi:aminoglycoside/choline kinase family phosphotransferase
MPSQETPSPRPAAAGGNTVPSVTDSPDSPVLSATETRAAQSLLAAHWGTSVTVRAAEKIWDRHHIVRLHLADDNHDDRSVVLKRRREENFGDRARGFDAEVSALEFLNAMEPAVAPRLFGVDLVAGILIMEDLGPGSSLADSLLARDRQRAQADLVSYARAVATMHAWSVSRSREYAEIRSRHDRSAQSPTDPDWIGAIARGKAPFLAVSAQLGLPTAGLDDEIDALGPLMSSSGLVGLVHSDLCPDNTHMVGGDCRLIDFETSGWGPIALDVAYLLAPFPSCWCFASLPSTAADPALRAYRDQATKAGIDLGPDWETALAAALAGSVVGRGQGIGRALDEDGEWGTSTMRPRLLTWLNSFIEAASRTGALPRLRAVAEAMHERLRDRWPGVVVPDYPALARPGATLAQLPRKNEA